MPFLAVSWRRLHDIGRSGLWLLAPIAILTVGLGVVFLINMPVAEVKGGLAATGNLKLKNPVGGLPLLIIVFGSFLTLLIWLCKKSQPGPNKYGPNPHEVPL